MGILSGLDFIREKVRRRDNYTCQACGKVWQPGERRLDVHHLDPEMESVRRYSFDAANMHRLITLCHKCHLSLPHLKEQSRVTAASKIDWIRHEQIRELRERRWTFQAIADLFGVTKQRVHQIYHRQNSEDNQKAA